VALKLFWRHGYEGTSIARLAEAIGINVPSLYGAFGNKEALYRAAVERYSTIHGCFFQEALEKETAREVARYLLEQELRLVTQSNAPDGCLMIQGALVTGPGSEQLCTLMAGMRAMAEDWMAQRFERARQEGDLPHEADPKALACYLMTLNAGLAVQAKSGVPQKLLAQVIEIAMANWPTIDSSDHSFAGGAVAPAIPDM